MKNIIIIVLLGILAFIGVSYLYNKQKNVVSYLESFGGTSYAAERARTSRVSDREKKDISIGVLGNWSRKIHAPLLNGVIMASEEINKAGGVDGRKINLEVLDNLDDIATCKKNTAKYCANPEISAIIGGMDRGEFRMMAPFCEFHGLLMISPLITSGVRHESEGYKRVFKNYPNLSRFINTIRAFLEKRKLEKTAIISPPEYHYDYYFCNEFDRHHTRNQTGDAGIVARRNYHTPYRPHLIEDTLELWRRNRPFDSLLIGGDPKAVLDILRLIKNRKVKNPIILTDMMEINALANFPDIDQLNTFLPSVFDAESSKKATSKFREAYKKRFGKEPTMADAQGYDTLKLLVAAIRLAGSTVPDEIADALRKIKYQDNVSTFKHISFDSNGELDTGEVIMKSTQKGGFKAISDKP